MLTLNFFIMKTSNKLKSTSNKQQTTTKNKPSLLVICFIIALVNVLSLKSIAQTPTPFVPPISTSTTLTTTSPAGPIHLSCDGLVDDLFTPLRTFKAFAWDGAKPGWGYEYSGNPPVVMSYFLSSKIHEPEIALVSDVNYNHIYALLIYVEGSNNVVYEFYKWDGTLLLFPATPTLTGSLGTSSYIDGETAIAGDRYNHFAMACDQGFNTSPNLLQQTGYVDPTTGSITLGTIGNVNYGGTLNVSQPDIDITFDGDAIPRAPYDAVVAITFSYDNSSRIISNSIDMTTLFAGTTWNTTTGNVVTNASTLGGGQVDHPAISLNDGYRAWVLSLASTPQGIYPIHYGVAYHDFNSSNSIIYQYPVTLQNSWSLWSPYQVGACTTAFSTANNGFLPPENNNYPDIVVEPQEVQMIVAWNYIDVNGTFSATDLDAIANSFNYPFIWNIPSTYAAPCFVTTPVEMYFNSNPQRTPEMAISNFSEVDLLYFYYDNITNELLYKTRPFSATALRKGIVSGDKNLSFFPNPVNTQIQLLNFNAEENYLLEIYTITGSLVTSTNGQSTQLETKVNEQLPKLNTGLYLVKVKGENGMVQTLKLAKQ
jgi:hypothetical protein